MTSSVSNLQKVVYSCTLHADSVIDAFTVANLLLGNSMFTLDEYLSRRAGYNIYLAEGGGWIADIGDRLEVNFEDGKSKNIWYN